MRGFLLDGNRQRRGGTRAQPIRASGSRCYRSRRSTGNVTLGAQEVSMSGNQALDERAAGNHRRRRHIVCQTTAYPPRFLLSAFSLWLGPTQSFTPGC